MSECVLRVSGLGKAFRKYRSEWQRIFSWFGVSVTPAAEHWVLRDVSFSVAAGEAVGIVGQNGAGKSTLLKLITGTLRATEGGIEINGRIAAILELGMGFNPEFTGRQNVYHAAGLMGFSRDVIEHAMPEIEAFAEIGEYFDQPVRTYSSGMQMRVTFSVATAFRPDVLIVDEALSVGDAAFQRKCFRHIEDFISNGTALLFVSHDAESVKRICNRAVWLNHGRVVLDGASKEVCEVYEKHLFGFLSNSNEIENKDDQIGFVDQALISAKIGIDYGTGDAKITDFVIKNRLGQPVNVIPEEELFSVNYRVHFVADCEGVMFGMMIKTVDGVCVYATNTEKTECQSKFQAGEVVQVCFELKNNLASGVYYLNCGTNHLTDDGRVFLHRCLDVAILKVIGHGKSGTVGLANLQGTPKVSVSR
jgi:homopolymeric O-antigen transport system ATP-binding protein